MNLQCLINEILLSFNTTFITVLFLFHFHYPKNRTQNYHFENEKKILKNFQTNDNTQKENIYVYY